MSPSPTQSALGALQILSYVRGERIHDSTDLQALELSLGCCCASSYSASFVTRGRSKGGEEARLTQFCTVSGTGTVTQVQIARPMLELEFAKTTEPGRICHAFYEGPLFTMKAPG